MGGLEQSLGRRLTVDGVDHHLLGADILDGLEPGADVSLTGVIDALTVTFTPHEHGLDDEVAVEGLHPFDDCLDVVGAVRVIHLINIYRIDGVELQYVVIDAHESIVNLLAMDHGGVAEYGDLGLRTVLVAQTDGVGDDLGKVRVAGRLAVAGEGQHVGQLALCLHGLQLLFQFQCHLFSCREGQRRTMVFIEAALAVDAVEAAHLAIGRQEVDA